MIELVLVLRTDPDWTTSVISICDLLALVYDLSVVHFVTIDGSDNQLSHKFDKSMVELMNQVFTMYASV